MNSILEFPIIQTIDDVLWAIEGKPEFVVVQRDGFKVINYLVNFHDTFPKIDLDPLDTATEDYLRAMILRECRGIKFLDNGFIAARPYHKFFNLGERRDSSLEVLRSFIEENADDLELNMAGLIRSDKLDGSMIHPIFLNDGFRLCTKMGITDTSIAAEHFISSDPARYIDYTAFFKECHDNAMTPIFEYLSPRDHKIVVNYKEENLILTALRDMTDGSYYDLDILKDILVSARNIPFNNEIDCDIEMLDKLSNFDDIKAEEGVEGYVFDYNGFKFKVKNDWYLIRHRLKESMSREFEIVQLILDNKIDDILANVDEDERVKLEEYSIKIHQFINNHVVLLRVKLDEVIYNKTRKEIALEVGPTLNELERLMVFKLVDGKNLTEELIGYIKKNAGAMKMFAEFKEKYPDFPTL